MIDKLKQCLLSGAKIKNNRVLLIVLWKGQPRGFKKRTLLITADAEIEFSKLELNCLFYKKCFRSIPVSLIFNLYSPKFILDRIFNRAVQEFQTFPRSNFWIYGRLCLALFHTGIENLASDCVQYFSWTWTEKLLVFRGFRG